MWKTELKGDSDQDFILQSIQHGFSLIDSDHCIANIPTTEMPNHRSAINSHQMHRVEEQITSEVHEGNYRPIHNKPCIISALGALPKRNGDIRLIHDASWSYHNTALNDYATKDPCSYQTVSDALATLSPGDFMAKVDLQAAYRSVCVSPDQHTLTGLKWHFAGDDKPTFLVDTKLPFGSRKSPAIFNRISKSVQRMMIRKGYKCVVMLDDFFVSGENFDSCKLAYNTLIKLLRSLGFKINWRKVIDPCQDLVFLGIRINSVSGVLTLDPDKLTEIRALLHRSLAAKRLSKHQLQRLAGKLSWASNVIMWGRAHLWRIFNSIRELRRKDHKIQLDAIRDNLEWWRDILASHVNQRHIWDIERPLAWLYTDASSCGGGAFCHGDWFYVNWRMDTNLADTHINIKEFAMIQHALRHWGSSLARHKVIIYTDNMAAKAFINRQRAPSSIHDDILQDISKIATLNDISVQAVYLPSAQNCVADAISRFNEKGQIERFVSLLHVLYGTRTSLLYWLPGHMSIKAIKWLSPQISRWQVLYELDQEVAGWRSQALAEYTKAI